MKNRTIWLATFIVIGFTAFHPVPALAETPVETSSVTDNTVFRSNTTSTNQDPASDSHDHWNVKLELPRDGQPPLKYTLTVDEYTFTGDNGVKGLTMTGFYYHIDEPEENRPVIFAFNGGPGAASAYLHLGGIGPKRVDFPQPGHTRHKPRLKDNPYTLLTKADLVFIDPPGAGFNHLPLPQVEKSDDRKGDNINEHCGGEKAENKIVFNEKNDAEDFFNYIHHFLHDFNLLDHPVYLMGESYGGHRLALLSEIFANKMMILDGLILISPAFTSSFYSDLINPALSLPALARTAWYHNLSTELEKTDMELYDFAEKHYLPLLIRYPRISDNDTDSLIEKLTAVTGIPMEIITGNGLAVSYHDLWLELYDHKHIVPCAHDGRYSTDTRNLKLADAVKNPQACDRAANLAVLELARWLRKNGFIRKETYHTFAMQDKRWDWPSWFNLQIQKNETDSATYLDFAISLNPNLKIYIACGRYDMVTPCLKTLRDIELLYRRNKENIKLQTYEGGHMMYFNPEASKLLNQNILEWFELEPAL
ncbi:MAG: S10 family serine carboxypeptidase-like protein [Endozoicomonas sp.]